MSVRGKGAAGKGAVLMIVFIIRQANQKIRIIKNIFAQSSQNNIHTLALALPFRGGKRINQYIKQFHNPLPLPIPHLPCHPAPCHNNKLDLLRLPFLFPFLRYGAKYESIYCENVKETETPCSSLSILLDTVTFVGVAVAIFIVVVVVVVAVAAPRQFAHSGRLIK